MEPETDVKSKKASFYKRPKFYGVAILSALLFLVFASVFTVLTLRWVNPPTTSFMQQQNWEELGIEKYNLQENWVAYESIPNHMSWAVVAAEDQLFWGHWGFDIESIRESWEDRQEGIRSRGASSITQQVAKNLFLWPGESFLRKGIEAVITLFMELLLPKDRIMEIYLNIAEFAPGIFGIGKASDVLFNLSPGELEPDMSARLAAVLPSPKRMRVEPPSPFTQERSQWILQQMTHLSGIRYIPEDVPEDTLAEPEFDLSASDSLLSRPVPAQNTSRPADTLQAPGRDSLPTRNLPDSLQ